MKLAKYLPSVDKMVLPQKYVDVLTLERISKVHRLKDDTILARSEQGFERVHPCTDNRGNPEYFLIWVLHLNDLM